MSIIRQHARRSTAVATAMLAVLAVLTLTTGGAVAGSRSVHGEVVDSVVTDGSCSAIICTRGVYNGTIRGAFEFAITSLTPTDLPNVQSFVGHSTIHTAKGDLRCADSIRRILEPLADSAYFVAPVALLAPGSTCLQATPYAASSRRFRRRRSARLARRMARIITGADSAANPAG